MPAEETNVSGLVCSNRVWSASQSLRVSHFLHTNGLIVNMVGSFQVSVVSLSIRSPLADVSTVNPLLIERSNAMELLWNQ